MSSGNRLHMCADGWEAPSLSGASYCTMCCAALLIVHVTGGVLVFPLETGRAPLPVTVTVDNRESIGSVEVELKSTLDAVVAVPDRLIVQPGQSSEVVVSLDPNKLESRDD